MSRRNPTQTELATARRQAAELRDKLYRERCLNESLTRKNELLSSKILALEERIKSGSSPPPQDLPQQHVPLAVTLLGGLLSETSSIFGRQKPVDPIEDE